MIRHSVYLRNTDVIFCHCSKTEILRDSVNNFTYGVNTILTNRLKWIDSLECIWVLAVVADLVFQCLPQYNSPVEFLVKLGM